MKPDWDKLADEFKDSPNVAIRDVDCTAAGKDVCSKVGVSGYPTIKYYLADEPKPKDYSEGRDYKSLKKFVEKTFKAGCKVDTKEGCTKPQVEIIDELFNKSVDDLKSYVTERDTEIEAIKEKRVKHVEESKETIKNLKKEEDGIRAMKLTADKIVEFKEPPPPKKDKKDDDSDSD
jgi:hypothetical protein